MTPKEKIEEELSHHLNAAGRIKRRQVEENMEYKLAFQSGNLEAALDLAYGIIYGSAKTPAQHRRLIKKKKKDDWLKEIV